MMEPTVRFPEFKDSWNNYKIEDMFDRVGTPVDLDDTQTYREIGIRSHGKGIFHKEETTATEIGNKRVFWVEPDCFVVNIVFAWERAVAKTTEKENGMIASHRFPMYKPKKDIVDLDYITEYFITKRGQNVLILASPGGAGRNKTLGQKEFVKSVVKLPSLPEQQKIAEFLSTIDTVIEKQKETVSAWEERKRGVMQKLFSQEVRFRADDGSDFHEWENVTVLDLLAQPITDGPHETPVLEENGVSFVSVEAIDNGRVNLAKRRGFISKEYDDVCAKKYKPQLYDVYMVKSGATTGKVAIVTITDDFNIWSPLAAMRTSSKTEAFFLYYQLQSDMIQNQVWTKLSLGNQPNLGMRALELFSAVRPCLAEQQKIADCLSSLDEVIEKQKATLAAWEEMKKGLLQQMFV